MLLLLVAACDPSAMVERFAPNPSPATPEIAAPGGNTTTVPPVVETAPTDSMPAGSAAVLLGMRPGPGTCEVFIVAIPALTTTPVATLPSCPEWIEVPRTRGALLTDNGTLILDGAAVAAPAPPPDPKAALADSVTVQFSVGADGALRAEQTWGEGEVTWEEGPNYERTGVARFTLKSGAWVADPTGQARPAHDRLSAGESYPDGDWLAEGETFNVVREASLADAYQVVVTKVEPQLAWPIHGQGEGEAAGGPVLIKVAGAWRQLAGAEKVSPLRLQQVDDWLIVGDLPGADLDQIYDVRTRTVAWNPGATLWLWPADWQIAAPTPAAAP